MRITLLAALVALSGCDDTVFPNNGEPTGSTTATEGWCAVQGIFRRECLNCHSAGSGDLDLETDPYGALVGVTSAAWGSVLVEAGNADGSLLIRKLEGTQSSSEGGVMPPTGALAAASIEVVRAWIDDGATDVCVGGPTDTGGNTGRYHPTDWAQASVHGMATKFQTETDCRDCHGSDLSGGTTGISCTSCHGAGWETNCTFCHGRVETSEGAPPEDIDDNSDVSLSPFRPHTAHVDGPRHSPFDCTQCHVKPTDALTPGHLFDDATPGVAEVEFAGGLSPQGSWNGGTCSQLYCHGNGQGDNGSMDHTSPTPSCRGCHPDRSSSSDDWQTMSGRHKVHLEEGFPCAECHEATVDASQNIVDEALHVNKAKDTQFMSGVTFNGSTCTGICHGEPHNGRTW